MKKIISLLATLAMMVSVSATAFAAIPADAAPKAKVTLTDLGEADEIFHTYELKIDLADVGTLTFNKEAGAGKKYSGTKIAQFDFHVKGEEIYTDKKRGSLGITGWSGTGDSSEFTGIYASFLEVDPELNYPQTVGTTTDKCDGAVVIEFYGMPGTEVNLANGNLGYLTYSVSGMGNVNDGFSYKPVSFDKATLTLPGGEVEDKELAMDVDFEGKFDNGYVWTADITKGEGDVDSFTADFVSGSDSIQKEIKNIADLTSKFDGEGSLRFNIGLVTTKTLTSATFTVTDDAGGNVVVPAALSK